MSEDGTARRYHVVVDQDICMAAGLCYGAYPGLFAAGELGIAELAVGDPAPAAGGGPVEMSSGEMLNDARQASLACPSGAITVVEASMRTAD